MRPLVWTDDAELAADAFRVTRTAEDGKKVVAAKMDIRVRDFGHDHALDRAVDAIEQSKIKARTVFLP